MFRLSSIIERKVRKGFRSVKFKLQEEFNNPLHRDFKLALVKVINFLRVLLYLVACEVFYQSVDRNQTSKFIELNFKTVCC